jgi:hypothetical protein
MSGIQSLLYGYSKICWKLAVVIGVLFLLPLIYVWINAALSLQSCPQLFDDLQGLQLKLIRAKLQPREHGIASGTRIRISSCHNVERWAIGTGLNRGGYSFQWSIPNDSANFASALALNRSFIINKESSLLVWINSLSILLALIPPLLLIKLVAEKISYGLSSGNEKTMAAHRHYFSWELDWSGLLIGIGITVILSLISAGYLYQTKFSEMGIEFAYIVPLLFSSVYLAALIPAILRRFVDVFIIRLGRSPKETLLDDIIVAILSLALLTWIFKNSITVVFIAIFAALVPDVISTVRRRNDIQSNIHHEPRIQKLLRQVSLFFGFLILSLMVVGLFGVTGGPGMHGLALLDYFKPRFTNEFLILFVIGVLLSSFYYGLKSHAHE